MSLSRIFSPVLHFDDDRGNPLSSGWLCTFYSGTNTPVATYKDASGTLNEVEIQLDSRGECEVWLDSSVVYKFELWNKNKTERIWFKNDISVSYAGSSPATISNVNVVGDEETIHVEESSYGGMTVFVVSVDQGLIDIINGKQSELPKVGSDYAISITGNAGTADVAERAEKDGSGNNIEETYKTKQTAVTDDPTAEGTGLSFIDSVTQNANGVITPHKKTVQDGTTAQKGVVQLQDSVGSTESATDKAVTPHAVRAAINSAVSSAYHAAGTKTVAQLTSSLLVAENEGCVYNVTDSGTTTSDFVDGAGHPINAGDNVGVCDVGGGVYKFDLLSGFVDLSNYLTKTGDASDTTSTFTKARGDASPMTSGGKLSVLFTAISSFFASVASAIGGKADKVTSATNGNFANLDSSGNLTDSGKKAADFAVSSVYNETDPRNLRSFIKCEGYGTQFYRKLATTLDVNNASNSSVIKLKGCVGAWGSGDTTDFSIVVRTRGSVLFETSVFKKIGSNNAFDKVNFELYEESNGTYSLWLNSSAAYTKCAINAFAHGGAYIVYDGTNGTPTGTLVASASQNYKVMMVTDGDGSNVSVTPDGTSTGYDLGSSTTLKAFAQKFKNLVSALKALAFKDTVGTSDIDDDAITAAKVKDNETLPVNVSGTAGNIAAGGTSGQYLKSNGSGNAPSWDNPNNLNVGRANKLNYLNTNEINFTNVPSSNYNSHYFNHVNGDTNSADSSKKITDYYFEDRNGSNENVILHAGGITNRQYNSGYGGDGYDGNLPNCSRCIRFTLNSSNSTFAIRCLFKTGGSSINGGFVDLFIKTATDNHWDCTCFVSRSKMSSSDMGKAYYHQIDNTVYIVIKVGAYGNNCTPILLSKDGTVNVEFGDYSSVFKNYPSSNPLSSYINVYAPINSKVGDTSIPVYVDTDGSVKPCGFQVNFGTPIARTNVLNIVT